MRSDEATPANRKVGRKRSRLLADEHTPRLCNGSVGEIRVLDEPGGHPQNWRSVCVSVPLKSERAASPWPASARPVRCGPIYYVGDAMPRPLVRARDLQWRVAMACLPYKILYGPLAQAETRDRPHS